MSQDPRFARLKTDPRFRRPKRHNSEVTIDDRFKSVFKKPKPSSACIDKYGRSLSDNHDQINLKQYYIIGHSGDEGAGQKIGLDYARGQILLESSDEEKEEVKGDYTDTDDSIVSLAADASYPIGIPEEAEIDLDEVTLATLDAQVDAYNKSNPRVLPFKGEQTRRLAVVNIDWDHVRATHLYKVFASPLSSTGPAASNRRFLGGANITRGKVLNVRVYPSAFGKERMAREEKQGPPPEIFQRQPYMDPSQIDEKTLYEIGDADADYNEDALRIYQLERLRYYYAIVTCDTVAAAAHIYTEFDGTELERSANVLDLSFVPDDMTFDDTFRDEATENDLTISKPLDFVTDALRHSKVKLTWDDDDPERTRMTRCKFTQREIEEDVFREYIASSSDEDVNDRKHTPRNKLRDLLLGSRDEIPEGWDQSKDDDKDCIDMEITFTPSLGNPRSKTDETTLDRYQRKTKEKRKKRKEYKEALKASKIANDFSQANDGQINKHDISKNKGAEFDIEVQNVELIVPHHFDLDAILKAEGTKKYDKGKSAKKGKPEAKELQEDFAVDVHDKRFSALHEDHTFAIDPSNPHYKPTKGMVAFLNERKSVRRISNENSASAPEANLQGLVESIKRKGENNQQRNGKRRKF